MFWDLEMAPTLMDPLERATLRLVTESRCFWLLFFLIPVTNGWKQSQLQKYCVSVVL